MQVFRLIALIAINLLFFCPASVQGSAGSLGQTQQVSSDYVLGPEDVIDITVIRHPEFSISGVPIPPNGHIQIPVVGDVNVIGKSLFELQQLITKSLGATRLKKPEVTVTLKLGRLQRVYILGSVRLSGAYDWKKGWGVAQALSAAGGLSPEVQPSDISVSIDHISGAPSSHSSLIAALNHPEDPNLAVSPGDTVRFDMVATVPVYVVGKVFKPGMYPVRADAASVLSAIAQAGGTTPDASLVVKIVHPNGTSDRADLTPTLVHGDTTSHLPLVASGDLVVVSEELAKFSVLGYVNHSGSFPIPGGHEFHLADAIALAQGAVNAQVIQNRHGRITRIGIVRLEDGKPIHLIYNLDRYVNKADLTQNPLIHDGDLIYVPQSDSVDLVTILTALASASALDYNLRH